MFVAFLVVVVVAVGVAAWKWPQIKAFISAEVSNPK